MSIPAVLDSGCFGESFKYLNRKGGNRLGIPQGCALHPQPSGWQGLAVLDLFTLGNAVIGLGSSYPVFFPSETKLTVFLFTHLRLWEPGSRTPRPADIGMLEEEPLCSGLCQANGHLTQPSLK